MKPWCMDPHTVLLIPCFRFMKPSFVLFALTVLGFIILTTGTAVYSQPSLESIYGFTLQKQEPMDVPNTVDAPNTVDVPSILNVPGILDAIIINGWVFMGDPPKAVRAQVGIQGQTIAYIGPEYPAAKHIINADGKVVTPGFIDLHTHSDRGFQTHWNPVQYLAQGVTTIVAGNCGISPLGIRNHVKDLTPLGINYALFIGHNSLRFSVMHRSQSAPTARQMKRMQSILKKAMEEGALGMSTGLAYSPGKWASDEEIIELLQSIQPYDAIYATHIRSERAHVLESVSEAIHIALKAKVPLIISHLKCFGEENVGKSTAILKAIDEAISHHQEVYGTVYPFHATGSYLNFLVPPSYRHAIKRKNALFRKRILGLIQHQIEEMGGAAEIYIGTAQASQSWVGYSLEAIGKEKALSPEEVVLTLLQEDFYTGATFGAISLKDMIAFLHHPRIAPVSDSSLGLFNHPRATSLIPVILHHEADTEPMLSVSDLVMKMAYLPAQILHLEKRGKIKVGYQADLVIFNPQSVYSDASHEHPEYLTQGMDYVFLNGTLVYQYNHFLGDYAGQWIQGKAARSPQNMVPRP